MKRLLAVFLVQILFCNAQNTSGLGERRPSPTPKRSIPSTMTTILPALPEIVTPIILANFTIWKAEFNETVDFNKESGIQKLINFAETHIKVEKNNEKYEKGEIAFKCELNSRAILSTKEKQKYMNGLSFDEFQSKDHKDLLKTEERSEPKEQPSFPPAPASLDYRKLGYVTEIVDQGFYCSSCYAYSAQAALEGAIFKKYRRLQKLSDQVIIDCNKNRYTGNWGCNGGWMSAAFEYIIGNNGTEAASTYPLKDVQYPCKFNSSRAVVSVQSYGYIVGGEEIVKRALAAIGPLSVGINGGIDSFFNYGKGIYDDIQCSGHINHAVTLVGYGTDYSFSPSKDYWIIKNSWGAYWGEGGYMRILRGLNLCGISNYVVYPIV